MKYLNMALAAILALSLTIGMAAAQDNRSPEEREFEFRDSLFRVIAWKLGRLGAAKAGNDSGSFKRHAADMAYLAGLITEGFQIRDNIPADSLALSPIWKDFDDFGKRADTLEDAAATLAASGDMGAFNPRQFGSANCGGCHREYKKRDD